MSRAVMAGAAFALLCVDAVGSEASSRLAKAEAIIKRNGSKTPEDWKHLQGAIEVPAPKSAGDNSLPTAIFANKHYDGSYFYIEPRALRKLYDDATKQPAVLEYFQKNEKDGCTLSPAQQQKNLQNSRDSFFRTGVKLACTEQLLNMMKAIFAKDLEYFEKLKNFAFKTNEGEGIDYDDFKTTVIDPKPGLDVGPYFKVALSLQLEVNMLKFTRNYEMVQTILETEAHPFVYTAGHPQWGVGHATKPGQNQLCAVLEVVRAELATKVIMAGEWGVPSFFEIFNSTFGFTPTKDQFNTLVEQARKVVSEFEALRHCVKELAKDRNIDDNKTYISKYISNIDLSPYDAETCAAYIVENARTTFAGMFKRDRSGMLKRLTQLKNTLKRHASELKTDEGASKFLEKVSESIETKSLPIFLNRKVSLISRI